jgi:hypothetical protein
MTNTPKRGPGRPPIEYTEELAERICSRLIEGESMNQIAKDPDMPSRATMLRWMAGNADFGARCARARLSQAEGVHDQMVEIENGTLEGSIPTDVARVVLSSKQWRAAKLAPKKYGDKQEHTHLGPEGGPVCLSSMTPEEFEERAKKIAGDV